MLRFGPHHLVDHKGSSAKRSKTLNFKSTQANCLHMGFRIAAFFCATTLTSSPLLFCMAKLWAEPSEPLCCSPGCCISRSSQDLLRAYIRLPWVLPEDLCKKDPCNCNTEMSVSKVGSPCPTPGQLLASRISYALLVGEEQPEIARARFRTPSCPKVGPLLVNSSPTPHPWEVAGVFLAVILWQHPTT